MPRTCDQCGKTFEPRWPSNKRPSRFCSQRCNGDSKRQRVIVNCAQCGNELLRIPFHAVKSTERGPFCDFRCYGEWQSAHIKGPDSPSYQAEAQATRNCLTWKQSRKSALERDGFRCTQCGADDRLHVHHIESIDSENPHTHDLGNLTTLCSPCHSSLHNADRFGKRVRS